MKLSYEDGGQNSEFAPVLFCFTHFAVSQILAKYYMGKSLSRIVKNISSIIIRLLTDVTETIQIKLTH